VATIKARYPEWEPAEGGLETLLQKGFSRIAAILRAELGEIGAAALQALGLKIVELPPIFASPASVATTWTMIDEAGYTIPAGTQVAMAVTGERSLGFRVVKDVVVEPGETATAVAEVTLQAIEPGEEGNGLSGPADLVDALAFVEAIVVEGVSANGVDEE